MTQVAFISHSDCGRHDTGWNHPEHVGRLRAIPRALSKRPDLFEAVLHHEGRHATVNDILLAHDQSYIETIRSIAASGGGTLDADTTLSEGSWDAASVAVGCVLDGVDMSFSKRAVRSFSAVRPPGHHALRAKAMGFCIFGSVAVAAHYAIKVHGCERVLIVDWDVHHGNGTQALVENDPRIRFVSMHQWPWYPGSGAANDRGPHNSVWNVPMSPSLEPQRYTDALLSAIDSATNGWAPDILFISAGFDCLDGDPLGAFTLRNQDIELLTRELVARSELWCGGRIVSALEGGYAPEQVAEAAMVHLAALR